MVSIFISKGDINMFNIKTQTLFDRMLDDTFDDVFGYGKGVHVENTDGGTRLHIDLPGVKKEDIKVTTSHGSVNIHAERKGFVKSTFSRNFAVSGSFSMEDLTAEYTDGVLTLLIPSSTKKSTRTVDIK